MHWFLEIANFIWIVCYGVRDVLLLRILAILAMLTIMPYYFFHRANNETTAATTAAAIDARQFVAPGPVRNPSGSGRELDPRYQPKWREIRWNVLFILINAAWVILILRERRPPRMTPDQRKLYEFAFHHSCSPQEMLRLLSRATWKEATSGERLVSRGTPSNALIVIHSGAASIQVDGQEMGRLRDGDLAGDMSYLTGQRAVADVIAEGRLRYVSWQKEELERLFEQRIELKSAIQGVIGQNLVERLTASFPSVPELSMDAPSNA